MSPPRPQKRTLFEKVRSIVRYLRDNLSLQLQRLAIVLQGFLVTIRSAGFMVGRQGKALREELRSDHADELAVFLNSKTTKEEIRFAGIKLSAVH